MVIFLQVPPNMLLVPNVFGNMNCLDCGQLVGIGVLLEVETGSDG